MTDPKPIPVTLADTEVLVAQMLATLRGIRSRDYGAKNTPFAGLKQEELDLHAVGAELAFCKYVNLWPDLDTSVRPHAFDCRYRGYRIDVKHTSNPSGNLIARFSKKAGDADIYVLVKGEMPAFRLIGWAYDRELIDKERFVQPGGPYLLPVECLRPIVELKELTAKGIHVTDNLPRFGGLIIDAKGQP